MGNVCCNSHAIGPDDLHGRSSDSRSERLTRAKRVPDAVDLLPGDVHDSRGLLKGCSLPTVLKDPGLAVDHKDAGQRRVALSSDRAEPLHHD